MKILTKTNIKELNLFKTYKNAIVCGKGPTFKTNFTKNDTDLVCAINQTINHLDNVDMLCCNDIKSIQDADKEKLKDLKFLLIPEYLHINDKFNENGYWEKSIYPLIKDYFNGYYIIYNLKSNPKPNPKYINLKSAITSSNNCVEFIALFTNINLINLYGIAVYSENNYNTKFSDKELKVPYTRNRINFIKNHLIQIAKLYKIKMVIN